MESPKPVPFPCSLVVKKGSNIFFLTSSDIPEPVSEIETITSSLDSTVEIVIVPSPSIA